MRVVVVRLFNVVGAGMRDSLLVGALARRACEAIKAGSGTLRIGNLLARRDFLSATDAAKGCVAALDAGRSGEIYNLCSGTGVTVESVARSLVAATGHDLELVVDPSLDRGADASVGSPRKAREDFGFAAPIPLGRAIAEAWEFVRAGDTVCASAR
jgi:GDP-4-dehydro-6-deoxy-D-mannose reductase